MALCAVAASFKVDTTLQQKMLNEADDYIDEMPEGLQDRLSDAVSHALAGFNSELEYVRNLRNTAGLQNYRVSIKEIKGGSQKNIPMRLYSACDSSASSQNLLIFFHSGGWSMGSLDTAERFCSALASEGKVKVVSVAYPLSPENPYPSAVNTCVEAIEYITSNPSEFNVSLSGISLGGDGAGGNLALETYNRLPDTSKIRSLVLYYPLLQPEKPLPSESKRKFGRGHGFDSRLFEAFVEAYKPSSSSIEKTLPPTLLISAGRDIIITSEKEFSDSHPEVEYVEFEGALHGFLTDSHQPTAFETAIDITSKFLSE